MNFAARKPPPTVFAKQTPSPSPRKGEGQAGGLHGGGSNYTAMTHRVGRGRSQICPYNCSHCPNLKTFPAALTLTEHMVYDVIACRPQKQNHAIITLSLTSTAHRATLFLSYRKEAGDSCSTLALGTCQSSGTPSQGVVRLLPVDPFRVLTLAVGCRRRPRFFVR